MCKDHGFSDSTVRRREKLGWSRAEALGVEERQSKSRHNAKKIQVTIIDPKNGLLRFDSVKLAANYYGIGYDVAIQRLNKHGWSIEQALGIIPPPPRRAHNSLIIEVDGIKFQSRSHCANYFGVDQRLVFTRLKRGWSLKEALNLVQRINSSISATQEAYVYQIMNKRSAKKYVGVTINPIKDRFAQHIYLASSDAKSGSLQAAIFASGSKNFEIKLLETTEVQHLGSREKHWIKVKSSTSPEGYNLNSGGGGIGHDYSHEVTLNNQNYRSISDIARANGIKPATLLARVRKMSLEEALNKPFRKSPGSS